MLTLARRGLPMLRAKRAIETLIEEERMFVELPTVEDTIAVIGDFRGVGIAAAVVEVPKSADVRGLREGLGLTREQFAMRYGFEVETLRNWETGRRDLDAATRSYLRVIANDPKHVEEAYAPTPSLDP